MARKVREKALDTGTARNKLKVRRKPYYRTLGPGLHVGYRRGKDVRRWVARVYISDGNYRVVSIGHADDVTEADGVTILDFWQAQDRARELHRELAGGDVGRGPYTVRQAIADYVDSLDGRASQRDTKLRLDAYVSITMADKEVAKLTKDEIVKWHRGLAKMPPRARTKKGAEQQHREIDFSDPEAARKRKVSANRVLGLLKAALSYALAENKITCSDRAWRVAPFEGANAARVRYLKVAEAKRLVNAADEKFRPLVTAALLSGCRYAELCRLKVSDVDLDAGTVFIQQSKSDKSRHVRLTEEGRRFFDDVTAGRAGVERIFGAWGPSHQLRPMKLACLRAKITPPVSFHALRHSFASLAVQNGMDLMAVASALGHSSTRMAERHYAHLSEGYLAKQIKEHAPRFGFAKSNIRRIGRR